MNLTSKTLLLTAGVLSSSMALSSTASIDLTNDMLNTNVNIDHSTFTIDSGVTYDKSVNAFSARVGFGIQDKSITGPLRVGLGARIYALNSRLEDQRYSIHDIAVAAALGGWYRYIFPMANRLSIYASGYYSPSILTISRLDHMYIYAIRLEYMTMHNTRAFISYGATKATYKMGERQKFGAGISVGVNVAF